MNKSPSKRFEGFSDEWEQISIDDVSKSLGYGLNAAATEYDGVNGYIRITDIDEDHLFSPSPLTSPEGNISLDYKLSTGDLLFARTGATTGKSYIYKETDGNLYFAGFLIRASIINANPEFVYQQTLTNKYDNWVSVMSVRSGQPGINAQEIKSYKFYAPELAEQNKVADFLCSVDKKISLLKEKHSLLTQYKKGVMQKLFKQEIRFKDDNGNDFPDWESVTLNDLMIESRIKGSTGDKARKMTVKLWGKGVFEKDDKLGGSENTQYYKRKSGQFIYSKLDFLNCAFGIVPDELDGLETTVDLPCFDIESGINKYFILEYIKQKRFYKKYGDMADGSRKAKRIHAETFLNFPVNLPCEKEQDKIADFLTAIDKKLNAVNQQVELTQTFKKGLLQQMFV